MVPTTKLVRTEGFASALTTHYRTVTRRRPKLQLVWTRGEQVSPAANDRAKAFAFVWGHSHGDVETVHKADGVGREVLVATVVETELCQRDGGGPTEAIALYAVATISCGTVEMAVGVGAAGSGPDTAGPVGGWCREGTVGQGLEGEAASFKDRVASVGLDSWVNGERAVVNKCQNKTRLSSCSKAAQEEKGREAKQRSTQRRSHFLD